MKLKKILASILCVAMVLSTMSFSVFADEADVWDGVSVTTEWYDANPNATEFYINSASDLAGLAQIVNNNTRTDWHPFYKTTIYLNVDIDLNQNEWTPIGTSLADKTGFYGNFDGQNHTISNLWISNWSNDRAGLFGYTHVDAEGPRQQFKNFTVENATVTSSKNYVAAVIASAFVADIDNVHLKGDITIQGSRYVGGMVGHGYANMSNCTVEAEGTINSTYWCCGSLIGYIGENSTGRDCKVIGTGDDGLSLWSAMAGIGGAFGMPNEDCTFDNISVANVNIDTSEAYVGYGVGYIAGDYIIDPQNAVTNSVVSNVTAVVGDKNYIPSDATVAQVAVAQIGDIYYSSLKEAIYAAAEGDTIYLLGEISEGTIKLPNTITDLTIDGQGTAVVKDTVITAADGNSVNYQGLAIKNTTFDNSRFVLGGVRNGDVIYKDIVFDNNKFMNIVNTESMAAVHMNLDSEDNEYIENFTFTNNVIDGVTGSNNSGVLLKSIKGDVIFEGNTVSNVAWNALQIATAKADANLVIKNNSFASNGSSVLNIAAAPSAILENNAVVNDSGRIGLWYPAEAKIGDVLYIDIQTAINNAEAGDTITILAGEYDGFNVPVELNNVTFVGETDADGNNLVTIKTLEEGIESHNGGIFVQAETTAFKNLNFTAGTVKGVKSGWMSSSLGNTNGDTGMSSSLKNLTVENCNFTGSGAYQAIWTNQGNVTVKNSTITKYDTAVDTYGIHADQKMVIENTEIADVRNAFHTGEAEVGSQIDVTETTIDSDVIDIGGAAAVTITNSEISNAVVTTYTENNQMTISGTLLINSVINEEAKGRYNGVNIAEDYDAAIAAVAENNEIISTKLNISFEQVEAGLYNIVLNGEDDIYEFVGAELTFKNESTTFGNEYMNYEILGIGGKTNAEKSIEKADTYALRLVDGAERMSDRDLVIGQVKFYGQGNINFTVSEGTVVTTEYGTNLGQYYTLDADDTTADTLTVDAIANGAVEEVTRTVVVNVAYNHALDGTYWNDNQITVTLKDGFGNVYDPEDLTNGVATINNVKLGRLTVTLEAPGFRKYVYNTTLEAGAYENDALVLNFWNNVKRNEELNGVVVEPLAEIETGKGFMAHNFVVGDIVMDYTVDEYDLAAVTSYYGMYGLEDADKYIKYDLNRDGNIDIIDVHYVLHTLNN